MSEESEDEACPDSADTAPSAQGKASTEADPGLADESKSAEGAEIPETDPGLGDEADAECPQDEEGAK